MKVALYARVSTSEEAEMQNPKTQFLILRKYAREHDLEIVHAFVDHRSGKDTNRPGFRKLMEMATDRSHPIDAVVILRLDRFIRNAEEGMVLIKKLERANVALILVKDTVCGNVDTSTPIGEFFVRIVLALGELERKQTAERVKEGIARRIHEGKGWGQKVRKDINTGLAIELLKVRGSLAATAKELGVPRNTLRDHFVMEGVDYQTYLPCRNTLPRKREGGSYTSEGGEEVTAERSPPTCSNEASGGST
ncbi:MAG: recombinase family protein [Methanomassiliicoccus sp.]|nr:recombinase family protein [Methanomassiliicoccus sp.]